MAQRLFVAMAALALLASSAFAGIGDPQVKTDHPWYGGELTCSTFDRLFATQAQQYERTTGRKVDNEEDKALASWFYRNTHVFHCTEGAMDLWDQGPGKGADTTTREYWKGLFADGYSLCFATHAQWHGEMKALLGPGRSRSSGVQGHTSFEVFLTGGEYGQGNWALLDHDISTVIFTPDGKRLLGLLEITKDIARYKTGMMSCPERGWRSGGLYPGDPGAYAAYNNAHYAAGYAGLPPMVHLRAGESLRRYLEPGLEDGKTCVFWGINYTANGRGTPGPERGRTWVNRPEKMYNAQRDTGDTIGQGRYGNAVYTYKPDFAGGKYKEGVVEEADDHVTLEFYSPYIVGCTPPDNKEWGVYEAGGKNGLIVGGKMTCPVGISTDQGKTWQDAGAAKDGLDLTDLAKGHLQYWIKFGASAKQLADSGLSIRTVCQASQFVTPRLRDGENKVTFEASGKAYVSAGPNRDQAAAHLLEGQIGGEKPVVLVLSSPRKAKAVQLYAACRQASGSPPRADASYNIDYSTDGGQSWKPVVKDWKIIRHEPEPADFWSQSFTWGDVKLDGLAGPVRVRFNTAGRTLQLAEAHLVYEAATASPTKVTFAWKEGAGEVKTASHTYPAAVGKADESWKLSCGKDTKTAWVEYAPE